MVSKKHFRMVWRGQARKERMGMRGGRGSRCCEGRREMWGRRGRGWEPGGGWERV